MIRKLGSMGKLVVRRNSLAGITSIFKDKNKDPDKDSSPKKKDKTSAKSPALQAEVSHVHAELDRVSGSDSINGLSPAAELARQHTLRTKAENAARAKAQKEVQAAAAAAAAAAAVASASSSSPVTNGTATAGVPTWDKNTTTRTGSASPVKRLTGGGGGLKVAEDGTRVVVEDEDEDSDEENNYDYNIDGWDDDDDWDVPDTDEDATIRVSMSKATIDEREQEDVDSWAQDIRRSIERTKRPMRGILKSASSFYTKLYS
jgi:hypothetical protein